MCLVEAISKTVKRKTKLQDESCFKLSTNAISDTVSPPKDTIASFKARSGCDSSSSLELVVQVDLDLETHDRGGLDGGDRGNEVTGDRDKRKNSGPRRQGSNRSQDE